ncbi:MAG: LytTR family transcriptional regulator [Prevotellaceae bacterium]|jgi:DNA-binding LytR/AlgR family response regulator|nr:LytTR family transcriptional regulator [Prevotellaceae bacterium]
MKKNTDKQKHISIHFSIDADVKSEVIDGFFNSLSKVMSNNSSVHIKRPLFIPSQGRLQRIRQEEVLYFKAERNYCTIHFLTGKSLLVSAPLSNVARHFLNDNFTRIHRSYVINTDYLEFLLNSKAILTNGIQLPVNKEFKKDIYNYLEIEGTKSKKYFPGEL